MVREMKKRIPAAIIDAANMKVHRDLLTGDVSKETMNANKIAVDRMKVVVSAESAKKRGLSPTEIAAKEKDYEDRFGVATTVKEGDVHESGIPESTGQN